MRISPVAMAMMALSASSAAHGATVSVQFCWEYNISFTDSTSNMGDDHWTDDTVNKPARGANVRVKEAGWPYTTKWQDYTPHTDGIVDAGCTPYLILTKNKSYNVTIYADAELKSSNFAEVIDTPTSSNPHSYTVLHTAWSTGSYTKVTPVAAEWNLAAVAGYALWKRGGGVSSETFTLVTEPCGGPTGGGNCFTGTQIKIEPDFSENLGADEKFSIAHEVGHAVFYKGNGDEHDSNTGATAQNSCPGGSGHIMNSREHQTAASWEGLAGFYSAALFNSPADTDCRYGYYQTVDWDVDAATSNSWDSTANDYIDCESGAIDYGAGSGPEPVAENYYDDGNDTNSKTCADGGTNTNKSTEYDWLRAMWDLHTDEDKTVGDIVALYAQANDGDWNSDNTTGPTSAGNAFKEMRDAAFTLGGSSYRTAWENVAGTSSTNDENGLAR